MQNSLMENDIKKCKKALNSAKTNRNLAPLISTKTGKQTNLIDFTNRGANAY